MTIDRQQSEEPREDLVLEFTTEQGRMRVHGSVELEGHERVRFDARESPEMLQEREYVRVPPVPPVSVQISAGEDRVLSYALNVSGGGVLLAGPGTLKLGDELSLRLMTTQGAPPIQAIGVVVRADGESRRGISFKEISDGDRRRLVRFVFEVMREERQSMRNRSDEDAS
jgi:c-di-GMP-binding flagellar brake protein YcgR